MSRFECSIYTRLCQTSPPLHPQPFQCQSAKWRSVLSPYHMANTILMRSCVSGCVRVKYSWCMTDKLTCAVAVIHTYIHTHTPVWTLLAIWLLRRRLQGLSSQFEARACLSANKHTYKQMQRAMCACMQAVYKPRVLALMRIYIYRCVVLSCLPEAYT